jgi:1,4-dihydroxy-2-naphthoate octaprenyltransferase
VPVVVFLSHLAPVTVMLVHFAIPIAALPVRVAFANEAGPPLVRALKRMAVAELVFALALALGLLL